MLAGGIGGTTGDAIMHSLDTVKTRQQGDPNFPPKYTSMASSYLTIFRQEGLRRGLYGGITAAMLGSFPGTVIFFGAYEFTKRRMLDAGINPSLAFLTGGRKPPIELWRRLLTVTGFLADLAASIVYVPSEVLKTRLQLQGRFNNPFFRSGYNYRSTWDAARTIVRQEGAATLYSGYKATIFRDLPFSAFQFAIYEQEQNFAREWVGGADIGLGLEIVTAASAGGIAGVLTCPLDVVKTRTQTQINPDTDPVPLPKQKSGDAQPKPKHRGGTVQQQSRRLHTSVPRTVHVGMPVIDTSSIFTGLKLIYKAEGFGGWFRGVGPRFVWTSVQSGTMLVMYQYLLKQMARWASGEGPAIA